MYVVPGWQSVAASGQKQTHKLRTTKRAQADKHCFSKRPRSELVGLVTCADQLALRSE